MISSNLLPLLVLLLAFACDARLLHPDRRGTNGSLGKEEPFERLLLDTPAPNTRVPTTPPPTQAVLDTPAPTTRAPTTPKPVLLTPVPTLRPLPNTPKPVQSVLDTPAPTTKAPTTPQPVRATPVPTIQQLPNTPTPIQNGVPVTVVVRFDNNSKDVSLRVRELHGRQEFLVRGFDSFPNSQYAGSLFQDTIQLVEGQDYIFEIEKRFSLGLDAPGFFAVYYGDRMDDSMQLLRESNFDSDIENFIFTACDPSRPDTPVASPVFPPVVARDDNDDDWSWSWSWSDDESGSTDNTDDWSRSDDWFDDDNVPSDDAPDDDGESSEFNDDVASKNEDDDFLPSRHLRKASHF